MYGKIKDILCWQNMRLQSEQSLRLEHGESTRKEKLASKVSRNWLPHGYLL